MSTTRNLIVGFSLAVLSAATAVPASAMPLASAPATSAPIQRVDYWNHGHYYRNDPGPAQALGVFALTAAAIAASAQQQPAYSCPPGYGIGYDGYGQAYCAPAAPAYYAPPPPVVYGQPPAFYEGAPGYAYRRDYGPQHWRGPDMARRPQGPHVVYYRAPHPAPHRGAPACRHYEQCR